MCAFRGKTWIERCEMSACDPKRTSRVLMFWFEQTEPDQWFEKDAAFDASIREYFLGLHEIIVSRASNKLLTDPQTALAAVIVLDQMSRNIFRDTPRSSWQRPQLPADLMPE